MVEFPGWMWVLRLGNWTPYSLPMHMGTTLITRMTTISRRLGKLLWNIVCFPCIALVLSSLLSLYCCLLSHWNPYADLSSLTWPQRWDPLPFTQLLLFLGPVFSASRWIFFNSFVSSIGVTLFMWSFLILIFKVGILVSILTQNSEARDISNPEFICQFHI